MLKYLIVGVLDTLDEHHGTHSIHKDVVWSGPTTKRMDAWVRREETTTDGHASMTVVKMTHAPDYVGITPYGYSTRRHAETAIKKLTARGAGFMPLKGVHSLHVIPVLLNSDGSWQIIESKGEML